MSVVHVVLAWSAVLGCAGLLVAAGAIAVGLIRSRTWLDRAILLQGGTALAASIAGALVLGPGLGGALTDPLHVIYGAMVVATPVTVRYLVRNDPLRRIGRWMTIAGAIVGAVLIRSFMTGG